jgi:hypothetical protein
MSNLPSPIPSPDINAPSPEPDNDDFDLPSDVNFYNANGTFGSFLSDGPLPFDVNEFYRDSPPLVEHNQSIQVIQSQEQQQLPTAPLNDFYSSIMPQKMEAYNPALGYNDSYRQQSKQPPLPLTAPAMNFICTAPPPPPPISQNNNNQSLNSSNNDDYSWNEWNLHHIDTPVSPPNYERKGHDESSIVEYVDENLRDIDSSLNDIDHRQLFGADLETKGMR